LFSGHYEIIGGVVVSRKAMQLIATILEGSVDAALAAIAALPSDIDGVEIRFDAFTEPPPVDAMRAMRKAAASPLIATSRSVPGRHRPHDPQFDAQVLASGFDLVDVELSDGLDLGSLAAYGDRVVLSLHDFEGLPDYATLRRRFISSSCAHLKIAATPRTFAENAETLASLQVIGASIAGERTVSVIGMGERGLYSRILAPFFGSHFFFAAGSSTPAAPGQLPVARAREIYGDRPARRACGVGEGAVPIFAVVGNPAGHSVSPVIHNALFRQRGVRAAYTIASIESFDEILQPFVAGDEWAPHGLSITAPFKEDAFAFAELGEAVLMQNARACRSVNTLVRVVDPGSGEARIFAENTDVDAFVSALQSLRNTGAPPRAAIIGAGGTARSALVALRRIGAETTVYNRTLARAEAIGRELGARPAPLEELARSKASIIINTLSGTADSELPRHLLTPATLYIDVDYSGGRATQIEDARAAGATVVDGLALVHAQAVRQNELFVSSLGTSVGDAVRRNAGAPGDAS
jgi:shikimate dehydrogenase/3-dehydroquinate dehydratase type I